MKPRNKDGEYTFTYELEKECAAFKTMLEKEQYAAALKQLFGKSDEAYDRYKQAGIQHFQLKQKRKNLAKTVKEYERLSNDLMNGYFEAWTMFEWAIDMLICFLESQERNSRKRWTKEEDDLLIELACEDDTTMVDLALMFGRSPSSIQTRITNLVGVKRLSLEIAGRFIGNLNGEHTVGIIEGELIRGVA